MAHMIYVELTRAQQKELRCLVGEKLSFRAYMANFVFYTIIDGKTIYRIRLKSKEDLLLFVLKTGYVVVEETYAKSNDDDALVY